MTCKDVYFKRRRQNDINNLFREPLFKTSLIFITMYNGTKKFFGYGGMLRFSYPYEVKMTQNHRYRSC